MNIGELTRSGNEGCTNSLEAALNLLEAARSRRFLHGIAHGGWPDWPDFSVGNFDLWPDSPRRATFLDADEFFTFCKEKKISPNSVTAAEFANSRGAASYSLGL